MAKPTKKKWTYKVNNHLRAFGETDLDKGVTQINKQMTKKAEKNPSRYGFSKKDSELINTEVHEMLHRRHPRMLEKDIRKRAREVIKKMSAAQKHKIYSKFDGKH